MNQGQWAACAKVIQNQRNLVTEVIQMDQNESSRWIKMNQMD